MMDSFEKCAKVCFIVPLNNFDVWYGVLGIYDGNSVKYIYNTNYDLSVLKRYKKLAGESAYYQLYPTFVIDDKFFEV